LLPKTPKPHTNQFNNSSLINSAILTQLIILLECLSYTSADLLNFCKALCKPLFIFKYLGDLLKIIKMLEGFLILGIIFHMDCEIICFSYFELLGALQRQILLSINRK